MTDVAVRCPVCGARAWEPAGTAYSCDRDRWYPLSRCSPCGLRACLEWAVGSPQYEPTYYSQIGKPQTSVRLWLKVVLESAPGSLGQALAASLLTVRVPPAPAFGARLLDVGCGNGELLARAAVLGWDAEGCEVDDPASATARARGFTCYSDEWWRQLVAGRYDLIIMSHVLEHLHDPRLVLKAVVRALSPSGRLVIGMPNFAAAQVEAFGGLSWVLMPPEHIWHLEPRHLDVLIRDTGLMVERRRTQPVALDALGPRRLRMQYRVCRKAGTTDRFLRRYLRATVSGLSAHRSSPLGAATIYSYTCRRAGSQ